jgi:hypothetical protein
MACEINSIGCVEALLSEGASTDIPDLVRCVSVRVLLEALVIAVCLLQTYDYAGE